MTIKPLKAAHGDAMIIKCSPENPFTIFVDGGPEDSADSVVKEFCKYDYVDLIVLTHYVEDHICGLLEYVRQNLNNMNLRIEHFWVNAPDKIVVDYETQVANYENADNLLHYLLQMRDKGIIGELVVNIHNEFLKQAYTARTEL